MTLFQFIFSAETEKKTGPSLQTLSARVLVKNIEKNLYERFPDARPVKKSLRDKLSIDGDFSQRDSMIEQLRFIDTEIEKFNCCSSIRDLISKSICLCLPHIIDKTGRYVAKRYHDQLSGSNIDAIVCSGMEPNAFCLITNEYLHTAIARSARYNFVLHYGYDKESFDNQYRYDFYVDDDAAKEMYHKYFKPRMGDLYLNHGTTVKVLFFGGSGGESLPQAAAHFRHVLIKVALENTVDCSMLKNLQASHTVKQVVNDDHLYQQECVAARNAKRDGLLWSKVLLDQAIAKEKYNFMWCKEFLRYGAILAWGACIRYYCSDVKL